jgi:NADPH2:quinone reductase
MRAMVMHSTGSADQLQLEELPTPAPEEGELLVRLHAAGVNPVDTKLRSKGTYYPELMPAILGCDGAGVVEEVGDGVSRFRPGDEVWFCNGGIGGDPGCYAEYTVIDQQYASRKPSSIDFATAAAAPLVLITAWESLHDRAQVAPDKRVLIHAGAGGVGHVAIQIARIAGAHVCTTISSREKADHVRRLGADEAINYRTEPFVERTIEWSKGGVDIALDTVGGTLFSDTFAALRPYGDLVTLLQPSADTDWKQARNLNLRISLELMLTPMVLELRDARIHQREILDQCADLIDDGRLQIDLAHTLPLDSVADAHRLIEQGGMRGKIALTIS